MCVQRLKNVRSQVPFLLSDGESESSSNADYEEDFMDDDELSEGDDTSDNDDSSDDDSTPEVILPESSTWRFQPSRRVRVRVEPVETSPEKIRQIEALRQERREARNRARLILANMVWGPGGPCLMLSDMEEDGEEDDVSSEHDGPLKLTPAQVLTSETIPAEISPPKIMSSDDNYSVDERQQELVPA